MVFLKIKEYFLRKALLKHPETMRYAFATKKIKNIGILTTQALNDVYSFDEKVKKEYPSYNNVNYYIYREFNKADEKSFHHFSTDDFEWRGKINDASLQVFIDTPFDLLICYFDTNNVFLETLVKHSQANFKIGFADINPSLFDLEISEKIENVTLFNTESKKYLQILGSDPV